MAKKICALAALMVLVISSGIIGCQEAVRGSGTIVTRSFEFEDFKKIEAGQSFEVEVVKGSSFSVSITADDNLFDDVRVAKSNGVLKIGMRPGQNYFPTALVARVVMPEIHSVNATSASEVTVTGFNFEHDFNATATGASVIELSGLEMGDAVLEAGTASNINGVIRANDLDFEVYGASRVNLSGVARNLHINGSGASNIDLSELTAKDATVGLNGASSARLNISGRLDAGLSGASNLKYLGDPTLGNINLSDFSSVSAE